MNSVGGAVIYFPPGEYDITRTLTVGAGGVTLVGQGLQSKIRAARVADAAEFVAVEFVGATGLMARVGMEKLAVIKRINSPLLRATTEAAVGIRIRNVQRATFRDLQVMGFGVGVKLDELSAGNLFDNVRVDICETGLLAVPGPNPYGAADHHANSIFQSCTFEGYAGVSGVYGTIEIAYGVRFAARQGGVGDVSFRNCTAMFAKTGYLFEGAAEPGAYRYNIEIASPGCDFIRDVAIDVRRVSGVRVIGGYLFTRGAEFTDCDDVLMSGVRVSATNDAVIGCELVGCTESRIVGCTFDHVQYGALLRGTSYSTVTACTFVRNRFYGVLVDGSGAGAGKSGKYNVVGNCVLRRDPILSDPSWVAIRETGGLLANHNRFADNVTDGGANTIIVQGPQSSKTQ